MRSSRFSNQRSGDYVLDEANATFCSMHRLSWPVNHIYGMCSVKYIVSKEVDWQIWIAQGDRPYPCRYVITSKLVANGPQYSIQIKDWKTGNEVASDDFSFKNATNAKKIDLKDLDTDELPKIFAPGGSK